MTGAELRERLNFLIAKIGMTTATQEDVIQIATIMDNVDKEHVRAMEKLDLALASQAALDSPELRRTLAAFRKVVTEEMALFKERREKFLAAYTSAVEMDSN